MSAQNVSQLSPQEQHELAVGMSQRDFLSFCVVTDEKYEPAWFHEEIADRLQKAYEDLAKGKSTYLVIEMPPRTGKSVLASVKFPAWVLGKDPGFPVIVASYALDLAQKFGQMTRDIMQSGQYQAIFKTRLREDTKAKGNWLTGDGGGYTAAGIGGPITGKGGRILILDDCFKNREEAESELMRDKIWTWWTSTFFTRREPPTVTIVILTRWHLDDIVGRLEAQETEMAKAGLPHIEWEYLTYKAVAEEDEPHRKIGEALWPQRFPIDELQKIENAISVFDWSALYQQSPIIASGQEFKQEYFKQYELESAFNKRMSINILVDPAISKKKESANSAIVAVGKETQRPHWYVLDYVFGKFDPGQLIDALFKVYQSCRKNFLMSDVGAWVESVAYQKSLIYFIEEEQKRRKEFFNINEVKTTGEKEIRIRGLVPLYRAGVIWHLAWMKDLERELMNFPKGKTVDIADALSFNLYVSEHTEMRRAGRQQPYVPSSPLEGGETRIVQPRNDYPLRNEEVPFYQQKPYQSSSPYEGT